VSVVPSWRQSRLAAADLARWPDVPLAPLTHDAADPEKTHGTTVYLAQERDGHLVAGVSTSGWAFKYPGRLGDSPLVGAGCYVDDHYGAAACIGQGELTIRAGTARAVVLYLKMGLSLQAACREAVRDLQTMRDDLRSFVMIHALSAHGEAYAIAWGEIENPRYWMWQEGMAEPVLSPADWVAP
jgi:L-asparaginase